ncbi:MAG TPA: M14 family zinc carboxypeptidase [Vicinamibacterales bacterium]|nr:M14 family zinc carboxypeptidase [Vicinamibacterales bacterium]
MRAFAITTIAVILSFTAVLPARQSPSPAIPTPESVLGFQPGADSRLANYEQVLAYFQTVDAASDRVMLVEAGKSSQGRTYYFALISSAENLRQVDRYREIARRLAHPEGLTDEEARRLAREGKAFVHVDGGLHSSEVAGPQHTPQLLYDLVSRADQPDTKAWLDNVIVMLWPTINPDGQSMVADYYMARVGTPSENQGMNLPRLYQEYVGHDNNRDAYMLNTIESRVMEFTWRQWEPSIIYVHHQSSPFPTRIWLPPFAEPIAQHAPGLISSELNMIGMAIAQRLDSEGKVGATHMGTGYDAWYPGYIDYNPVFKNIPAFWTETQGTGPSPRTSAPEQIQENMRRPQALYVSPWLGGTWRLRDAVEYMETASMATIEYASKYKDTLLYGRYQSGRDQIARGRTQAPYAYFIPRDQRDPVAAVEMLRRLAFSGVRVTQLTGPVQAEGETFPAGTWVVPADQEFAAVAREVLEVQKYPEIRESPGGPLDTPYDAAGWTLPLSMGVRTVIATKPLSDDARSKMKLVGPVPTPVVSPVPYNSAQAVDAAPFDSAPGIGFDASPAAKAIVPPAGRLTGTGAAMALNPAQNNTFKAINRAWRAGATVQWKAGADAASGRYIVSGLTPDAQDALVSALALSGERVDPPVTKSTRPRAGLLMSDTSIDEGWTRWVLDQYEFEYVRVSGEDIAAGNLKTKIDVLVVPDDGRLFTAGGGRGGRGGGAGAGAGAAAGGGVSLQSPAGGQATEDARVKSIDEFVRGGGTLVCFNRSGTAVIDQLKIPVRNVVAGVNRQQFFVGGSLLTVLPDATNRFMAGMPERAAVYYDNGPVFETLEGFKGAVIARYPDKESPLASGFLQGASLIQGKAAAIDAEVGQGHVLLLGFRPQWRGQPFGSFRIFFNAMNRPS